MEQNNKGGTMRIGHVLMFVFCVTSIVLIGAMLAADPAPVVETTEVKPWQLTSGQRWLTVDDAGAPSTQLVVINRTGERVDSIEVWPPAGVPVTIHTP